MRIFAVLGALALLFGPGVRAAMAASAEDADERPIAVCSQMPPEAVISALERSEAVRVCRAMGLLDGVRVKDVRDFSVLCSKLT